MNRTVYEELQNQEVIEPYDTKVPNTSYFRTVKTVAADQHRRFFSVPSLLDFDLVKQYQHQVKDSISYVTSNIYIAPHVSEEEIQKLTHKFGAVWLGDFLGLLIYISKQIDPRMEVMLTSVDKAWLGESRGGNHVNSHAFDFVFAINDVPDNTAPLSENQPTISDDETERLWVPLPLPYNRNSVLSSIVTFSYKYAQKKTSVSSDTNMIYKTVILEADHVHVDINNGLQGVFSYAELKNSTAQFLDDNASAAVQQLLSYNLDSKILIEVPDEYPI